MAGKTAKDKAKPQKEKPYKGDPKLRETFENFGKLYRELPDDTKQWVGELLVLAHRLDERVQQVIRETAELIIEENGQLRAEELAVMARSRANRYRAQRDNARRDFLATRQERDQMRAQRDEVIAMHNNLLVQVGAAQDAFLQEEERKALAVQEALNGSVAGDA